MKRLFTSAAALALTSGAAFADTSFTILHTNDFHDRWDPISKYDSTCSTEDNAEGKCFGGIARLVTAIGAARERAPGDVLLLDAGDMFQGSLFYTQYGGDLAAEFMTALDYDAMAVGNHEFDDGPDGLAAFLDQVDFPVLSANIDVSQNNMLAGKVAKSTVLDVAGSQVGIVSVLAEDTAETSSPGDTVIFSDAAMAAQGEIDALTGAGIDKIILLTHVGITRDLALAETLTDVDLIIGGHTHTPMTNDGESDYSYPTVVNDVPVLTAYAFGKYLGEVQVTFDDAGKLTSLTGDPVLIDGSVAEDEATLARVAELAAPLEELRAKVVAQTSGMIDGARESCRAGECQMGNLVAEAMLDRVKDQGVSIAITNGGGLRASIDDGEVTMGEVLTVLPFQNTLSTFEVTGEVILAALENGVSQIEEGAGRFPQVAGMKFTFDPKAEPGARISDVMTVEGMDWAPLDPAKTYKLVSNNYVRNGGDGYKMFKDAANAYDFGPDLADVTAEYMIERAPYEPFTDGRIQSK